MKASSILLLSDSLVSIPPDANDDRRLPARLERALLCTDAVVNAAALAANEVEDDVGVPVLGLALDPIILTLFSGTIGSCLDTRNAIGEFEVTDGGEAKEYKSRGEMVVFVVVDVTPPGVDAIDVVTIFVCGGSNDGDDDDGSGGGRVTEEIRKARERSLL